MYDANRINVNACMAALHQVDSNGNFVVQNSTLLALEEDSLSDNILSDEAQTDTSSDEFLSFQPPAPPSPPSPFLAPPPLPPTFSPPPRLPSPPADVGLSTILNTLDTVRSPAHLFEPVPLLLNPL